MKIQRMVMQHPALNIEERPWTAAEIAEQIKILAEAAYVLWRDELEYVLYTKAQELHERRRAVEEARGHVTPGEKFLARSMSRGWGFMNARSTLYLKVPMPCLNVPGADRTGQPISPPVSVDLTISKGSDAGGV
jgi:hypothetical protein